MSKLPTFDSARRAAVSSASSGPVAHGWRGLLLCSLFGLLVACGGGEPEPAPSAQTPPAGVAPEPAAEPVVDEAPVADVDASADSRSPVELFQAAGKALSEERLFEPRGDNAIELYLKVIEGAQEPDVAADEGKRRRLSDSVGAGDLKSQAEIAIADIFPYGLLWVDRAIRENRKTEAERVIGLLERAQPGAESVARLRQKLTQPEPLPAPIATTPTAPRPTAPVAQPTPPPTAAPSASTTPASTTATPAQTQPAASTPAQPAPAPAQTTPTPAQPTAPVAAQDSAPPQLKLRRSASPRYPPRAYRQRIEGYVVVGFTVTASGKVNAVRVIEAEPTGVFDREAMEAVSRFEFEPPGRDVPTQQRIDFKMGR